MTDKAVNSASKQNGEVIKTIEACLSEVEGLEIAHSREYPAVASGRGRTPRCVCTKDFPN
ncbi:hypothetical protein ES703_09323 [subsurface metagenome]